MEFAGRDNGYEAYYDSVEAAKRAVLGILHEHGGRAPVQGVRGDPRLRVFVSEEITAAISQMFSDLAIGYADAATAYVILEHTKADEPKPSLSNRLVRDEWGQAIAVARERKAHREVRAAIAELAVLQYVRHNSDEFRYPGLRISKLIGNLLDLGLNMPKEAYLQAVSDTCRRGGLRRLLPGRLLLPEEQL